MLDFVENKECGLECPVTKSELIFKGECDYNDGSIFFQSSTDESIIFVTTYGQTEFFRQVKSFDHNNRYIAYFVFNHNHEWDEMVRIPKSNSFIKKEDSDNQINNIMIKKEFERKEKIKKVVNYKEGVNDVKLDLPLSFGMRFPEGRYCVDENGNVFSMNSNPKEYSETMEKIREYKSK